MPLRQIAIAAMGLCLALAGTARAAGGAIDLDALIKLERVSNPRHTPMTEARRGELGHLSVAERRPQLDRWLAAHPDDLVARSLRAVDEFDAADTDATLQDLDILVAAGGPAQAVFLDLRAEMRLRVLRYAEALADSDRALASEAALPPAVAAQASPGSATYLARGWALCMLDRNDEALRDIDKALAIDPDHAVGHWRRAMVLTQLAQHDRARADIERALVLDPAHPSWHVDLGDSLWRLGRRDAARTEFDLAIRQAPALQGAWARRARLSVAQARWDDALADATQALSLSAGGDPLADPDYQADAYWSRAKTWFHKSDDAKALADIDAGEAVAPRRAELPILRGSIESSAGHWEPARAAYTRALTLKPRCATCLADRAAAAAHLDDRAAALADAQKAVEIAPDSSDVHASVGIAFRQLKDYPQAIQHLRIAIRLNGSDSGALDLDNVLPWIGVASSQEFLGQHAEAIRTYTSMIDRFDSPFRASVLRDRGLAYEASGDLPRAIADFSASADAYKSARAEEENAADALQQGRMLLRAGRIAEAAEPLRVAVRASQVAGRYEPLWIYVSRVRTHPADELAARQELAMLAPPLAPPVWRDSLVDFLQGRIDLPTLQQRAADGPADKRAGAHCEANYYAAEVELAHGRRDPAMPLLAEAVRACPPTFFEAHAAKAESRMLGAKAD